MCIAIPGKIKKIINENTAYVDFDGIEKEVTLDLIGGASEVEIGDYILVHVGYAISKISEIEAKLTNEAFDEILEANKND